MVYVVELHAAPGDVVQAGDLLAVVETNKTTLEVDSPAAGRVAQVVVRVGDEIGEDALLMTLEPSAGP